MTATVMKGQVSPSDSMPENYKRSAKRTDIQGLRAILMLQVLLFHAWRIGSPIGVDSFIMISAYLMTSSFLRRTEAGRMPFFIERWGNTFKRLLPPLVVVVLATLTGSLLILGAERWKEITIQSFASITYWQNWRLAAVSTDYYADDHALSSPLQHLWSMSMQGQMFLLWPLLMTVCVLLARKLRISPRGTVAAAFALISVGSLLWLIYLAPNNASVYFDTRSRIWEFALGSVVAALAPWLKIPSWLARLLVPASFMVLLTYCLVAIGEYPGPMAAVPIICVSIILLYAPMNPAGPVSRFLSLKPLVGMGNISYAVYLIHWPVFVLFLAYSDMPSLGVFQGIVLIEVAILLGWLLTKYVDDPVNHWPWANKSTRNKWIVVFASLVLGLEPVLVVYLGINETMARSESESEVADSAQYSPGADLTTQVPDAGPGSLRNPGARVLLGQVEPDFANIPVIPSPIAVGQMLNYEQPCPDDAREILGDAYAAVCSVHGDMETAKKRVLVAGSSHAQQIPQVQVVPLLDSQQWVGVSVLGPGCAFTMPDYSGDSVSDDCKAHNRQVLEYIDVYKPDIVFILVTLTHQDSTDEELIPGVLELVEYLTEKGISVVGVSDTMRSQQDLWSCSDWRPDFGPYGGCVFREDEHFTSEPILDPLLKIRNFYYTNMRDAYCVDGSCPTIIGNVAVYFDTNHITTAYSRSVAPFFSQRVLDAFSQPWSPQKAGSPQSLDQ